MGRAAGSRAGPAHGRTPSRQRHAPARRGAPPPSVYGPIRGRGLHRVRPRTPIGQWESERPVFPPPAPPARLPIAERRSCGPAARGAQRGGAFPVSLRQVVTRPIPELVPHPREQRDRARPCVKFSLRPLSHRLTWRCLGRARG